MRKTKGNQLKLDHFYYGRPINILRLKIGQVVEGILLSWGLIKAEGLLLFYGWGQPSLLLSFFLLFVGAI